MGTYIHDYYEVMPDYYEGTEVSSIVFLSDNQTIVFGVGGKLKSIDLQGNLIGTTNFKAYELIPSYNTLRFSAYDTSGKISVWESLENLIMTIQAVQQ